MSWKRAYRKGCKSGIPIGMDSGGFRRAAGLGGGDDIPD